MKEVLITDFTAQNGSYFAEFLLEKSYGVHSTKRGFSSFNTDRMDHNY